jgi:hypothetical protein
VILQELVLQVPDKDEFTDLKFDKVVFGYGQLWSMQIQVIITHKVPWLNGSTILGTRHECRECYR